MSIRINRVACVGALLAAGLVAASCASSHCASCCAKHGQRGGMDADAGESETIISLADLPAAVRDALRAVTPEDRVTQVTRDLKAGQTTYDVEYVRDGSPWAVEFTPAGAVIANERDDDSHDDASDD